MKNKLYIMILLIVLFPLTFVKAEETARYYPKTTINEIYSELNGVTDYSGGKEVNGIKYLKTGDIYFKNNVKYVASIYGDLNKDGERDNDDIKELGNYLVNNSSKIAKDSSSFNAGDLNDNKKIELNDFAMLIRNKKSSNSKIHFISLGNSDAILLESGGRYGLVDASYPSSSMFDTWYNEWFSSSISSWKSKYYSSQDSTTFKNNIKNIFKEGKNANSVIDYVKKMGVSHLDFVIATNAHPDHIGGMAEIAHSTLVDKDTTYYYKKYNCNETNNLYNEIFYEASIKAMSDKNVKLYDVNNNSGDSLAITLGDYNISLFNIHNVSQSNEMANSIVVLLDNGIKKALLASDIDINGEKNIVSKIGNVNILKVSNHGEYGYTSKYLLKNTNPQYAIITADNSSDTLNKLTGNKGSGNVSDGFAAQLVWLSNKNSYTYRTDDSTSAIVAVMNKNINLYNYSNNNNYKPSELNSIINSNNLSIKTGFYNWEDENGKFYSYINKNSSNKYEFITNNIINTWLNDSNIKKYYYFDSNSKMVTNSLEEVNGKKYYFDNDGSSKSGLVNYKNNTYYFDETSYAMATGWITLNGNQYYFNNNISSYPIGAMIKNGCYSITKDGAKKEHCFDSNGIWTGEKQSETPDDPTPEEPIVIQGEYYAPIQGNVSYTYAPKSMTGICPSPVYHDIRIAEGTPVYAGMDGTAQFMQTTSTAVVSGKTVLTSYGTHVRLTSGTTTIIYGHLSRFADGINTPVYETCPKTGEEEPCPASKYSSTSNTVYTKTVKKGELIGYTGDTGNSDLPHLHAEIRKDGSCVCDPYAAFGMRSKAC